MKHAIGVGPEDAGPIETGEMTCVLRHQNYGKRVRVGDTLDLFCGIMRRRRLLRSAVCSRIDRMLVRQDHIWLRSVCLDRDQEKELTQKLGFCCVAALREHCRRHWGMPFNGALYHWEAQVRAVEE